MSVMNQFAWRSQKSVGVMSGPPNYEALTSLMDESVLQSSARAFQYSPDGSLLAFAFDTTCLLLSTSRAQTPSSSSAVEQTSEYGQCKPLHTLEVDRVVDLHFSPRGRYLSTWQRPYKDEQGNNVPNLHIFDCETGDCVGSFERKNQQGCHFYFTENEEYCLRLVTNELHVFDPKQIVEKGLVGRLRLDGITSYEVGPGSKPSIAVFCGEKKGAPASVRVYPLSSIVPEAKEAPRPVCQKTFFKADKIQLKWNAQGSALLFVTSTDHDKTGKSYYGETNLYMMSTRGDFDCRVALDKEGPVHDFEWNPNGREFIAVYGYMPAKCTLFSYRINVIAELGTLSRNFVAFNPSGRLFCLAGFGNLSGTVDVWDREKLGKSTASAEQNVTAAKLFSFDASNSSLCQWSPDGQFILTATLSPRLRVDNCIRIWHCTGQLIHLDTIDELYQASWRPMLPADALEKFKFPSSLPPCPRPSPSAQAVIDAKKARAALLSGGSAIGRHGGGGGGGDGGGGGGGVYRPPGARNLPPNELRKIEEAVNLVSHTSSPNGSGASTPSNGAATYVAPGRGRNGKRVVPGAAPPVTTAQANSGTGGGKAKKVASAPGSKTNTHANKPIHNAPINLAADVGGSEARGSDERNGQANGDEADGEVKRSVEAQPGAIDKKIRNLTKKLKAIQDLKDRRDKGEKLEQTQLQKIGSEAILRKELAELE